jgi:hypothetical protein
MPERLLDEDAAGLYALIRSTAANRGRTLGVTEDSPYEETGVVGELLYRVEPAGRQLERARFDHDERGASLPNSLQALVR